TALVARLAADEQAAGHRAKVAFDALKRAAGQRFDDRVRDDYLGPARRAGGGALAGLLVPLLAAHRLGGLGSHAAFLATMPDGDPLPPDGPPTHPAPRRRPAGAAA